MIRMFVRHPVEDFGAWKQLYDDFDEERKRMGVQGDAVFRGAKNPNEVTVWHDFASLESAQAFADSDELREAMEDAGVAAAPTIWFTEPA